MGVTKQMMLGDRDREDAERGPGEDVDEDCGEYFNWLWRLVDLVGTDSEDDEPDPEDE